MLCVLPVNDITCMQLWDAWKWHPIIAHPGWTGLVQHVSEGRYPQLDFEPAPWKKMRFQNNWKATEPRPPDKCITIMVCKRALDCQTDFLNTQGHAVGRPTGSGHTKASGVRVGTQRVRVRTQRVRVGTQSLSSNHFRNNSDIFIMFIFVKRLLIGNN